MNGQKQIDNIYFSEIEWIEKIKNEKVGPGGNFFGISPKNVVIKKDVLTLTITKKRKEYSCAEIFSSNTFGYGSYEFFIKKKLNLQDPGSVIGLFLYNENQPPFFNEIDIELSRWNGEIKENSQYAVHDDSIKPWINRFLTPTNKIYTIHKIHYYQNKIVFESFYCKKHYSTPLLYQTALYKTNDIIKLLPSVHIRMNLWLVNGTKLKKRNETVTITKVKFTPFN
ncbi:MAG: glycoside hydrolase family 16 protein [Marinilabiliaceae bacterium]|nr:glycoside hydrolase family 16 protein [Marinilabiliaceae bacterium]